MNESPNKNMPSATILIPERRGAPSPGKLSPVTPSDDASPRPRPQGGTPAQKLQHQQPASGDQPKRVMRRGDSTSPTGPSPTSRPTLETRTSSEDSAITGEFVTSPAGIDEQEADDFTLDAFLLAAMKKQQDRMLLLKLDKELEFFINDKSRTRLDLPTMNAYHRLIAHKAAEYFKLNHSYDHDKKSVYMCKCPATEIPAVRFTDLIESDDEDVQEKPKVITIMKRRSPKSPARGLGNDLGEKGEIDRSKMSLVERQVLYEEARKRIFNDQDETNRGSNSSSPTMRPAESSGQGSPTASTNGEGDTTRGSKGQQQQPKSSGTKKGQQGRQNSGGSNGGNGNTNKPPLNRNGSGGGPTNGPTNNAQKLRQYTQTPPPFDRSQFPPQNYGRPGPIPSMGGPPPNSGYFNQSMGFEPTTVTPFTFPHEGVPSNQLYGIQVSQPDWPSGVTMYGPSPSHMSRDTWGSNPVDNGKNSPYYSRPPTSQPIYPPPPPPRPPSFLGQRPPYGYGGESYKGPMDGSAMQGGQPMMQKPGPGSFGTGNGFDPQQQQQQWWTSGAPHGGQWNGFNPNVGAGGGGYGGGIYNGGVAQQGHKPGFSGSAWNNNTSDMFSPNQRHPPPQATMPQHMMSPDASANINCSPGSRRSQNSLQGAGFVPNNQLSQEFGALNLGNNAVISTQQQQQQNSYAVAMNSVNLNALNASTMPPPTQVYDLERRPPPSTYLFDPNGPTPSSSTNSTAGSGSSYASAAAATGTNGSAKGSTGGPIVSLTSAFNPARRKENLVADLNGSASAPSVASGMVRSHSLHLPQPPANQAYQNMNLHRAQTSPGRKKEGTGMGTMTMTTMATTATAATTTTAAMATMTTTTTTTTTTAAGTGLLFEYPLQTPYDGVKPEDVAASAAVDHILELYDYAEDDVPVDAIFQNARLKHLPPSARGRGVILAIFKKAALAREVLDEHQAKESQGPTRFKIRVWEPVKANLSQTASSGSDEGEGSGQEGTDIDKADS